MNLEIEDLELKLNEVIGKPDAAFDCIEAATSTGPSKTSASFKSKVYKAYEKIKSDISSLKEKLANQGKKGQDNDVKNGEKPSIIPPGATPNNPRFKFTNTIRRPP